MHPLKLLDDSVSWRHHMHLRLPPLLSLVSQSGKFFHQPPPPSQICFLYLVNSYLSLSLRLRSSAHFSVRLFWTSISFGVNFPFLWLCMFLTHLLEPFLLLPCILMISKHSFSLNKHLHARHWAQRWTWKRKEHPDMYTDNCHTVGWIRCWGTQKVLRELTAGTLEFLG